jgi:hypothetical protein
VWLLRLLVRLFASQNRKKLLEELREEDVEVV